MKNRLKWAFAHPGFGYVLIAIAAVSFSSALHNVAEAGRLFAGVPMYPESWVTPACSAAFTSLVAVGCYLLWSKRPEVKALGKVKWKPSADDTFTG